MSFALAAAFTLLLAPADADAAAAAASAQAVPTGRLPRTVVPTHVALELRIDPAQERFSGVVRIDVDVMQATRTFWLHGKRLNVTQATLTPTGGVLVELSVTQADDSGVLRLNATQTVAAGKARMELHYDAPFGELQGAYRVKAGGEDYVLTQMEPIAARTVLPAFDEPGFKQPWDLSLVIPEALQGVANTRLLQTLPADKGWKKLVFATTERLPSYLLAFAVGPWDIVDATPLPPNAVRSRALPLRGIAPRGQGERMRHMLATTNELVTALERYFGIAYPYDKLDLLAAPDFGAGAMENPGLIVYRDVLLYADEQSAVWRRQAAYSTHAHELAHQWFGDMVTMPWWDDIWLNEAFATWMAAKVVDELRPEWRAGQQMMESSLRAMAHDSLASTRRIREPIGPSTDIESAFDDITYEKGGAVLAMFERHVGADRFRDGIRRYLREHAGGNATSADLIKALAAESERPAALRAAFESFLNEPGVPVVQVDVDCGGPVPRLRLEQRRFLPAGSTSPPARPWGIPLCVRWGDTAGTHEQCQLMDRRSTTLALPAAACPAWVMPNAGGAGYYRFTLAPGYAQRLEANIDALDAREQRAYADSVEAAFGAGVLDVAGFLRAAARLATAPERETAMAPLPRLAWIRMHLADTPAAVLELRSFIRATYGPGLDRLGLQPRTGDSDDDRRLRVDLMSAVAELGRDPALRATLAAQGRRVLGLRVDGDADVADGQLHPDAAPTDQRALALRVAMEDGDAEVFDALLAHAAASQDAEMRGQLLGAAGAATAPALRARALALALVPGAVRRNEIGVLLDGGWSSSGSAHVEDSAALRQLSRAWLDTHFETVAERVAPYGASLVRRYASGQCSRAAADTLQAKFAPRVQAIDGGPRALDQAVEQVRLCAALRARLQPAAAQTRAAHRGRP